MSKILIVEDDRSLGFVICDNLQQAGYSVNLIATGMEGLKEAKTGNYDLIILDVMLPELDGFKMAEQIRSNDSKIPILFLSAKSMVEDRLEGLRKGGDDYLTKPFSMEELLLKIRVFLKRTASTDKRDSYEIGTYQFVPAELMLRYGDTEQKLTAKESQLLELLCRKQDSVLKGRKSWRPFGVPTITSWVVVWTSL